MAPQLGGHRCRMRPKRPPVQGVIPSVGRLVIDATLRCSRPPPLLVDISCATIGEAEARVRAHSARPWNYSHRIAILP